ncbi:MAG: ABC transporter permease [Oscillospiraceae bacterium]|nr:ABC transporter permease [Oscillospiraceae bacterium]
MKVFKTCMIICKRRYLSLLLYLTVFMTLSIVMTALHIETASTNFSGIKPSFTVVNRDGDSPLTDGLAAYMRKHGEEAVFEDDRRTLQDATFYHATDYIVFLPPGFRDSFLSGGAPELETVVTTHTARGFYADSLVNQYLNLARVYLAGGGDWDEAELVSAVLSDLSAEAAVEKKWFGESAPIDPAYLMFHQMLSYILLVLNILCITNITLSFRRPDLRMRNLCAPIKARSLGGQQILYGGVIGLLGWLLLTATGFVMYGSKLPGTDGRIIALMLLNSLVYTVVALTFAALIGSFARSATAQNAAANAGGLVLCFLGGVFVPLEMLGSGVLAVARFLPTYWYVLALDDISALTVFDASAMQPVWLGMLIQLAFAGAFFSLSLAVGKHQNQSERHFSSTVTEREA